MQTDALSLFLFFLFLQVVMGTEIQQTQKPLLLLGEQVFVDQVWQGMKMILMMVTVLLINTLTMKRLLTHGTSNM